MLRKPTLSFKLLVKKSDKRLTKFIIVFKLKNLNRKKVKIIDINEIRLIKKYLK